VFGHFLAFEQTIWIVAAALYVLDVLRAIAPDQILLEERPGLRLRAVLARRPFEWGRRHLYLVGVLAPHRGVLLASQWGAASATAPSSAKATEGKPAAELEAQWRALDQVRSAMRPFRVLAVAMFALLFVAGPIATQSIGAASSILWLAAPAYGLGLVSALLIALRKRRLALSPAQAGALALECLLCPPYVANLPKKICALQQVRGSGIAAAKTRMGAQDCALLEETVRFRAEEEHG
jgi:hypothetical protein